MGSSEVEKAQRRLQEILQRAKQLQVPTREILSTRPARKLLTRTENAFIWLLFFGTFLLLLSGLFYVYWASQEVDTIKTVFRRARNLWVAFLAEIVSVYIVYRIGTEDKLFLFSF